MKQGLPFLVRFLATQKMNASQQRNARGIAHH